MAGKRPKLQRGLPPRSSRSPDLEPVPQPAHRGSSSPSQRQAENTSQAAQNENVMTIDEAGPLTSTQQLKQGGSQLGSPLPDNDKTMTPPSAQPPASRTDDADLSSPIDLAARRRAKGKGVATKSPIAEDAVVDSSQEIVEDSEIVTFATIKKARKVVVSENSSAADINGGFVNLRTNTWNRNIRRINRSVTLHRFNRYAAMFDWPEGPSAPIRRPAVERFEEVFNKPIIGNRRLTCELTNYWPAARRGFFAIIAHEGDLTNKTEPLTTSWRSDIDEYYLAFSENCQGLPVSGSDNDRASLQAFGDAVCRFLERCEFAEYLRRMMQSGTSTVRTSLFTSIKRQIWPEYRKPLASVIWANESMGSQSLWISCPLVTTDSLEDISASAVATPGHETHLLESLSADATTTIAADQPVTKADDGVAYLPIRFRPHTLDEDAAVPDMPAGYSTDEYNITKLLTGMKPQTKALLGKNYEERLRRAVKVGLYIWARCESSYGDELGMQLYIQTLRQLYMPKSRGPLGLWNGRKLVSVRRTDRFFRFSLSSVLHAQLQPKSDKEAKEKLTAYLKAAELNYDNENDDGDVNADDEEVMPQVSGSLPELYLSVKRACGAQGVLRCLNALDCRYLATAKTKKALRAFARTVDIVNEELVSGRYRQVIDKEAIAAHCSRCLGFFPINKLKPDAVNLPRCSTCMDQAKTDLLALLKTNWMVTLKNECYKKFGSVKDTWEMRAGLRRLFDEHLTSIIGPNDEVHDEYTAGKLNLTADRPHIEGQPISMSMHGLSPSIDKIFRLFELKDIVSIDEGFKHFKVDDMLVGHIPPNIAICSLITNLAKHVHCPGVLQIIHDYQEQLRSAVDEAARDEAAKEAAVRLDAAWLASFMITPSQAITMLFDEPTEQTMRFYENQKGAAPLGTPRELNINSATFSYAVGPAPSDYEPTEKSKRLIVKVLKEMVEWINKHKGKRLRYKDIPKGADGCPYFFRRETMPPDWGWASMWRMIVGRFFRVWEDCDRWWEWVESCETLILEIFFQTLCGKGNRLKLWLCVYQRHPAGFVIAHARHGERMCTGFKNPEVKSFDEYDEKRSNISIQSKFENFGLLNLPENEEHLLDEVIAAYDLNNEQYKSRFPNYQHLIKVLRKFRCYLYGPKYLDPAPEEQPIASEITEVDENDPQIIAERAAFDAADSENFARLVNTDFLEGALASDDMALDDDVEPGGAAAAGSSSKGRATSKTSKSQSTKTPKSKKGKESTSTEQEVGRVTRGSKRKQQHEGEGEDEEEEVGPESEPKETPGTSPRKRAKTAPALAEETPSAPRRSSRRSKQ